MSAPSSSSSSAKPGNRLHPSSTSSGASRQRGRRRSVSPMSPPPQPSLPHHELNNPSGGYNIDSADPVIGDVLYRYDDDREEGLKRANDGVNGGESGYRASDAGEAEQQPNASATGRSNGGDDSHLHWLEGRRWWKRPSQWWLVPMGSLLAIAVSITLSSTWVHRGAQHLTQLLVLFSDRINHVC